MKVRSSYAFNKRRKQVFRQRLLIMIFACILTSGLSLYMSDGSVDAHTETEKEESMPHKYYTSIKVSSGDTLWTIAERYMDEHYRTVREYIDELKSINGLKSSRIQDGQYLTVSYYDD